jgi:aminobenzoyl-glutamate utilization protein B
MKPHRWILPGVVAILPLTSWADPYDINKKETAVASIERQSEDLIEISDRIWAFAEPALRETRSSRLLADHAERKGFEVERGVAGMPTAFVATYGRGRPIIGILGEFDALPGISQKATPQKEPLEAGAAGHGCGHNLFGAGSLGAAVAIQELIAAGELSGTIRFYGTPAEEAIGGKSYMARDGLFEDLDACLAWHPDAETRADTQGSQAIVELVVEFRGRAAHAAYDPWNGRSALDGLELFTHGINMLREHVRPTVRMHYSIQNGGEVPNVIPEYARLACWLRDSRRSGVEEVLARVRGLAEGAGLMAGVESEIRVEGGNYEMLVNMAGARLVHSNLTWLGPIEYTQEEQEFARAIQTSTGVEARGLDGSIQPLEEPFRDPPGGSTDVADVSWIVPTLNLTVTTAPEGAPWHSWAVVASGGMSIGHKGLLLAAKTLAATAVDLYDDPATLKAIRDEFEAKAQGQVYRSYVPEGPPPVPVR